MGGFYNIKEFGAVGNGSVNDGPAIQKAINTLPYLMRGRKPLFFPPGIYRCNSTIQIPAGVEGIELIGSGWQETNTNSTTLLNYSDGYLFETTGTGACSHFSVSNMKLQQLAGSKHYFVFNNLTTNFHLSRIYAATANTTTSIVVMNKIENHMNWIHDIKIKGTNATVPMFNLDGSDTLGMSTTKFERIEVNTLGSTAPQFLIDHKNTNDASGFIFSQCKFDQAIGGAVHLNGVNGCEFNSCIVTSFNNLAPVFLLDREDDDQRIEATFTQCYSLIGDSTNPDIEIRNTAGTNVNPGNVNIIGGRFSHIKAAEHTEFNKLGGLTSEFSGDGVLNV